MALGAASTKGVGDVGRGDKESALQLAVVLTVQLREHSIFVLKSCQTARDGARDATFAASAVRVKPWKSRRTVPMRSIWLRAHVQGLGQCEDIESLATGRDGRQGDWEYSGEVLAVGIRPSSIPAGRLGR